MSRSLRALAAVALAAAVIVGTAAPAAAHAQLTSSSPADGATVDGPLEHIALEFKAPVVALEDQFVLVDGAGKSVALDSVSPDGESSTLHVVPAEPLAGDTYGLKWAARAGDTHPRTGTVTFTVGAVAAPTTAATTTDTAAPRRDGSGSSSEHPASHTNARLQEALHAEDTGSASTLSSFVRFWMYGGLLLAIGGMLYLALVHRGTRAEGRRLVFLVRRAAVVTILATLLELPFQAIMINGGSTDAILDTSAYADLLGGSFGVGVLLKLLGAALVLAGMRMQLDRLDHAAGFRVSGGSDDGPDLAGEVRSGSVMTRVRPESQTARSQYTHRVRVEGSPVAMLGVLALVSSELFIGHTASTEPRWLVLAAATSHLLAGGLWVAGVAMLAATLWRRHRQGAELEAAVLATRFSVVAIGAVAAVSITGLALGIAILDDLGGFVSTEFGRLLIVKVVLVVLLVGLGGYNQKVVIPSLERRRTSRRAGHRLRWLVTAEVATFLAVLAVTAALVGADSTG